MTDPASRHPLRRLSDQGRVNRAIAWWREYGALIAGVWLIVVSAAVLAIAWKVRQDENVRHRQEVATAVAARSSCLRSKKVGPAIVIDWERRGVLPHTTAQQYLASIGRPCPPPPSK